MKKVLTALAVLVGISGASTALSVTAASASTLNTGQKVLATAETKQGAWYKYGGNGPSTFDCSGLVVWAAKQHGLSLPRTTQQMIKSGELYRVYSPRQGDLAFWGGASPYHVEFWTLTRYYTFGERKAGTRAGWHNDNYWKPDRFYRFR